MEKLFLCDATTPVVQIKAGKLRGYQYDGTYIFKGISYAQAERFQQPIPVKPWEGIKDALSYGLVCPLLRQETPNSEVLVPHRYWPMDEHCQNLNIWTQSLNTSAKKPVMVWLHGGAFEAGSSIEQVAYEGMNMSSLGDVVVVSINHRLNILGYLDLSLFGEKYVNSANAGNSDIVAALKWIHENIEAFGGDSENVTLFGQSGGGMKITCMLQTPAADGLFQKGIIMSGILEPDWMESTGDSRQIIDALLQDLNIPENEIERLEAIPYHMLASSYNKVSPALKREGKYVGCIPMANDFYLGNPMKVGFCEHAKTIPLVVGSVFGEFFFAPSGVDKRIISEEEVAKILLERYKGAATELITLFKAAYPEKHLADLMSYDSFFRIPTSKYIREKAKYAEAPIWSYLFTFNFPYENGKAAWHCSDIPFVFHNTDLVPVSNVPGVSEQLEEMIFHAVMSFARTGDPNHTGLPNWPASMEEDEATMVFDKNCDVRHNFDDKVLQANASASMSDMMKMFADVSNDIQH